MEFGVASLATLHHHRTKVGEVCTIPVPSSVVTKSPEITLKACILIRQYQWH
jgi:hypothetical protein